MISRKTCTFLDFRGLERSNSRFKSWNENKTRAEKELAYHFVVFQIWTGHDPSLSCINFFVRKRLNDFHPFWHDIFRSYKFDAEKLTRESILSSPGISFPFLSLSQRRSSNDLSYKFYFVIRTILKLCLWLTEFLWQVWMDLFPINLQVILS